MVQISKLVLNIFLLVLKVFFHFTLDIFYIYNRFFKVLLKKGLKLFQVKKSTLFYLIQVWRYCQQNLIFLKRNKVTKNMQLQLLASAVSKQFLYYQQKQFYSIYKFLQYKSSFLTLKNLFKTIFWISDNVEVKALFQTFFIEICINCLNNFSMKNRTRVVIRAEKII